MARTPTTTNAKRYTPPRGEAAATGIGSDAIGTAFVGKLQVPGDPRLRTSAGWDAYDRVRKDDQVKSTLEQRFRAVVSAEWSVLPGDAEDPRAIEAADALQANLQRIGWDRVTAKMLWAIFYGYSVGELIWTPVDGRWDFDVKVRKARRFRYAKDGALRLLTRGKPDGEELPNAKFWVVSAGSTDDDELYGDPLADWLYWPVFFKRNGIRFWNTFLDKFGTPTAKATYRRGTPQAEINRIVEMLRALSTDAGIAVPEGVAVELLSAASSTGDFLALCRYMDGSIAKVVLSQTMTTDDGASLSQAKVHAGVKLEVVKADADLLSDSFNAGPSRWWTDANYGEDVAAPIVVRLIDEEADLKVQAETDGALKALGWERTDESFRDTYGDGYERTTPPGGPIGKNDDVPTNLPVKAVVVAAESAPQ